MSDLIERMAVEARSRCTMTKENARYVARGLARVMREAMREHTKKWDMSVGGHVATYCLDAFAKENDLSPTPQPERKDWPHVVDFTGDCLPTCWCKRPSPSDDVDGVIERLGRSITTAANDDLSEPMTDKRLRHTERLMAMREAATLLARIRDERDDLDDQHQVVCDQLAMSQKQLTEAREALEKIAMRDRMLGELQEPSAAKIARAALGGKA